MSENGRRDEAERAIEVEELEEELYQQPAESRLRAVMLLFGSLWKLVRGEDGRGRKVRWLLTLLRPYRLQVGLMFLALVAATAASLAPPYLLGEATDSALSGDVGALDLVVAAFIGASLFNWGAGYVQHAWSAGSASAHFRTFDCGSSATSRGCRLGSSPATGQGF